MTNEGERGGQLSSASLLFSAQVHSLDAIKKAAYRFCNVVAVDIVPSESDIACHFTFLKPRAAYECEQFIADFKIEVLDQGLREKISQETAPVRNAILAYAFSKTGLQG
jgi:His-Xaa-Ser system protein HxsD